jgi:hypothetical protein
MKTPYTGAGISGGNIPYSLGEDIERITGIVGKTKARARVATAWAIAPPPNSLSR